MTTLPVLDDFHAQDLIIRILAGRRSASLIEDVRQFLFSGRYSCDQDRIFITAVILRRKIPAASELIKSRLRYTLGEIEQTPIFMYCSEIPNMSCAKAMLVSAIWIKAQPDPSDAYLNRVALDACCELITGRSTHQMYEDVDD